ncbi:pentatricopeptide repeat-containing protein At4g17616 isoform X2 [Benincasa hispida]|nr:pentatricopeptide repeat-containing protein At4g17616 isoform X2 [Benincasa hispida]XP_038887667.1 pentatricopeptide repeat-containing protein At4g17616 isoform X2 [Benincasa hispida]
MLVSRLSYTSDCNRLQKACNLVLQFWKEKPVLLRLDALTKLSLALARSQMPIPASEILRLMLETRRIPQMELLQLVILHMVKSEIGTYIASNILVQICDCFLRQATSRNDQAKSMKPDTMLFNLVLHACVRFKLSLKGQQLVELMSQTEVVADALTIVLIARIYDMNGQRDELKNLKIHIDQVSPSLVCHYCQFYDALLSLHFKYDDFDSAANLVLEICQFGESTSIQKHWRDLQKSSFVPIGSCHLKDGLKIKIMPELLHKDSVLNVEVRPEFINCKNGKLVASNKTLAKLIIELRRLGETSELSKLLLQVQKGLASVECSNLCSDVVKACICLGWLETAHDILDDVEAVGSAMDSMVYFLLLNAYYKKDMLREANVLKKQMARFGLFVSNTEDLANSTCSSKLANQISLPIIKAAAGNTSLVESLVQEMKETNSHSRVYKFNSSIYFFCKAKMIEDALQAYKRMQQMGIQPTAQTFANLVFGFSSLHMYRDITILWGDMKRRMQSARLALSRDLYECLLLCFLQGGYFERVMEIVGHMEERNMYTDKGMYKSEFLMLHKNLYRSLKPSDAKTEAQKKRLQDVRAFKKWVALY